MKVHSLAAGLAAAVAALSMATDTKAELSSATALPCVKTSGGTRGYYGGMLMNTSTASDLQLMCPLVADTQPDALMIVGYLDRHPSKVVSCTLYSETYTSTGIYTESDYHDSTQAPEDENKLAILTMATGASDSLYALCTIPTMYSGKVSHITSFTLL